MVAANESLIDEAKSYVKELMKNNDPSHDWFHVERVWKNSMHIAEQEILLLKSENLNNEAENFIDLTVVELAALFHDIVDFKYENDKSKDLKEVAVSRLEGFFTKFQNILSNEQREKILDVILNISWRKELENGNKQSTISNELKIVRDADRLDAIGAIGIARCFSFSGAKYRPFYIEDLKPIVNMTAEEYNNQSIKNQSSAINHFYEKLLLIKDKIQTKTGKKLAEKRHQFMVEFLEQFHGEVKINL